MDEWTYLMIFSSVKTFRRGLEFMRVQTHCLQLTFEQHPPKISPTVLSDARMIEAMVGCAMALWSDLSVGSIKEENRKIVESRLSFVNG
jgi:hypothetical protein